MDRLALTGARQRGAALIVAMLVAALAATVALSLAAGQQQWFSMVEQRRDQVQAQALAQAGVQWARQILFEDARTGRLDYLGEPWALPMPAIPIENGSIEGRIVDAQGLLNVNNLAATTSVGTAERARFERLFARLGLPPPTLDAIADWIDPDSAPRPTGAEDAWYAAQPVPMLAANQPIVRTAELALVRGMSAAAVSALTPYVAALPEGTKLNVNTAPAAVLAASLDGLAESALPGLITDRAKKPYSTLPEFRARLPDGTTLDKEEALGVSSDYFIVAVRARQGATQSQARALLKRGGGGWPVVLWQTLE